MASFPAPAALAAGRRLALDANDVHRDRSISSVEVRVSDDVLPTSESTDEAPQPRRRRRKAARGSVYQRSDGRWCGEIALRDGAGRKYVYARSAAECDEKLTSEKARIRAGGKATDGRLTVGEVLAAYVAAKENTARPRTLAAYSRLIDLHLKPHLGSKRAADLEPRHVQEFLNRRVRDGLSASMAHHMLMLLRMAFKLAVTQRLVMLNPADGVTAPSVTRNIPTPLDGAESQRLLAAARALSHGPTLLDEKKRPHNLGALWILVVSLGLRRGEVLGLRWRDVDLDGGVVHVRHQLNVDKNGKPVLAPVKTKRSVRSLALHDDAVAALKMRKKHQAEEKLAAGEAWANELGLIFTAALGQPIDGGTIGHMHRRLCKVAGVRHVRFHDMRHGAATMMLVAGVDPVHLSAVLGHSRVAFTLDTYAHAMPSKLHDAVAKLAGVLGVTK
jgi:integrase